jgi:hypothetical protein
MQALDILCYKIYDVRNVSYWWLYIYLLSESTLRVHYKVQSINPLKESSYFKNHMKNQNTSCVQN